jgi:signal transduction histidine kinase
VDYILKKNIDYNSVLETAFEHFSTPAVILSTSGLCIRGNRAFWRLLGPTRAPLGAEVNITDYIISEERDIFLEALWEFQDSCENDVTDVETRMVGREGRVRPVQVSLNLLVPREFVLACVSMVTDAAKLQHEYQRRTEDLENLFYLISHNLKTPLVSIQGFVNLLMDSKDATEPPDLHHYLERIQKNAERMNTMVQDILTYSKVSKREHKLDRHALADIINTIYTEHYFRIKEKKIKLVIPAALPTVMVDREGISTVFENLIDNAIKYLGDTEAPEIEIGWENKGRFYVFWVKDNGPGVRNEYQDRVFDLFQRGDSEQKHHIEGTGVGLAIVKKIIEQHGGMVKLQSEQDAGTTVYFTIPAVPDSCEQSHDA